MLKVGVTGGIGSGKSLVCKVFKNLGIPIYLADDVAKRLYDTDQQLHNQMIDLFGDELYKNNLLDRKMLASIIFNDKKALNTVSNLVHPAIARDFNEWVTTQYNVPYVIQEAAILFESGLSHLVNKTITISSPQIIRIQRACLRDNVTAEEVKQRIANQMTDEERDKLADFSIVSNNSTPVLSQILHIHTTLISLTA